VHRIRERHLRLQGGVLLLVGGLAAIVAGLAAPAAPGNGYLSTPTVPVNTYTAAITGAPATIADNAWPRRIGAGRRTRVVATGLNGPIFLGVARTSDVDAWLAGTARYDLVRLGADPRYHRLPGAVRALPGRPDARSFWLARASGTGEIRLDWAATDEPLTVVLANSEGSADVAATVQVAASAPGLLRLRTALPLLGVLVALAGLALLGAGRRRTGHGTVDPVPVLAAAGVPQPRAATDDIAPPSPGVSQEPASNRTNAAYRQVHGR
jgi:hypothetical protein